MSTGCAVAELLSASEQATLEQFRETVADLSPPSREDWYLLKWLRARKFNVDDAKKMLREHIAWRKKHQVDTILEDYKVPTLFLKYCPGGFVECGLGGQPVYITPVGSTDIKGLLEAAPRSDLLRHLIYILETQEELKRRISLQNGGHRIDTMYFVADMEGFSFWQLSSIEVVSAITESVRLYEANYPEILEEAFVINAPSLFPVLWNIVKPLLSQRTISKINIFGKDGWRDVLASRFDVERLPAHWGGRLRGPDGDGRCPNLICPGGPVPVEYRKNWSGTEGTRSCTIGAGCCWSLPVSVKQAGSELRWKFGTASGDLTFSVRFRLPGSVVDGGGTRDVVAAKRLPSSPGAPHSGSLRCHEPGTYELVFDNSFSWLTRKELSYSVQLLPPVAERGEAGDGARAVVE
ncbi:SEC14-like protein 2 isoform X1 [Dermacentor albipictus]|uniref:SEC14-like protein 2 isoform X1 n=1 Tax=Dermacentor albipictus TaxID=60249 RepID=UPI0031FD17D1